MSLNESFLVWLDQVGVCFCLALVWSVAFLSFAGNGVTTTDCGHSLLSF